MSAAKPFVDRYWRYSLSAYAAAGVQTLCLRLQNSHAANVNLLLLGGFVGCAGQLFEEQDWVRITNYIAPFNKRYTRRIRDLRQRVQPLAATECYQQLKALELQAEQLEQQIIVMALDYRGYSKRMNQQKYESFRNGSDSSKVLQNLRAYQACWPLTSTNAERLTGELAAALSGDRQIKAGQALE